MLGLIVVVHFAAHPLRFDDGRAVQHPPAAVASIPKAPPSAPTKPAAQPSAQPAPQLSPCAVADAYLAAHADPLFQVICQPGILPRGVASVTCYHQPTFGTYGAKCPVQAIIWISQPSCAITYEDEASNSWLMAERFGLPVPADAPHPTKVDPFGECG